MELGDGIGAWRRKQLRRLQGICKRGSGIDDEYPKGEAARAVAPKVLPSATELLRGAMGWPDTEQIHLVTTGARVVGSIPKANIYRKTTVDAT
eukprot:9819592-Heterocapsa_arctica.AAC.1